VPNNDANEVSFRVHLKEEDLYYSRKRKLTGKQTGFTLKFSNELGDSLC
jgi:hypothetical protein